MTTLDMFAPAKLNLTLSVLGRRADGYHELETVMHQISLFDVIHLRLNNEGTIRVHTTHPVLKDDMTNLAWRAASLLVTAAGCRNGVEILIEKTIPMGAGLAGGSTDAAAVLIGLNRLLGQPFGQEELLTMGARLGSDVPFCLVGGTAVARGRGEILTPVAVRGTAYFVLVGLPIAVSTAEVYSRWQEIGGTRRPDVEKITSALSCGDWPRVAKLLYNGLESVTMTMYPQIERIKRELLDLGAMGALMSGSGPTVFGVFDSYEGAGKAASTLKRRHATCFLTTSCGTCPPDSPFPD